MRDEKIIAAARMIHEAKKIVVFTGAGISTESGVPDFRSPGGIWSQYNPDDLTYQRFRSDEKYRKIYWAYDRARYPAMRDAAPNSAHKAVVEIEKSGRLSALVTQNIDGLHQKAGSSPDKIYELHGTVREITCLDCHTRWPREEITDEMDREGIEVAYCKHCGGPLKCATIAFGQSLPQDVLEKSFYYAGNSDLFITIGSSLVVQPAASLPLEAKRGGARLMLVNLSDTSYDQFMDLIIRGTAGPAVDEIMAELRTMPHEISRRSATTSCK
jgi:NAD-dependent protein deacetylase/lipoamidase